MSKAFKVEATDIIKNRLSINSHLLKATEVMFKQTLFYFNRRAGFLNIGKQSTVNKSLDGSTYPG
jgi:hypothetical protein